MEAKQKQNNSEEMTVEVLINRKVAGDASGKGS